MNGSKTPITRSVDLPQVHQAAKEGNITSLVDYTQRGEDVNIKDSFGSTPLHLASLHGHIECVEHLVSVQNLDINCKDAFGRTPVFYAARNGHHRILELLISKGAESNCKTESGETPFLKASYYGHLSCLKVLANSLKVQNHNYLEDKDRTYGNTALHNASSRGHVDCIIFLLENGADINSKNIDGYTPLHLSVSHKQLECLKVLISHSADLETKNVHNKTPYEDAVRLGYKEIATILKRTIVTNQLEELKKKEVNKWSSQEVSKWLNLIGFGQYKDIFLSNDIKGRSLKSLNANSLKSELNITSLGHRTSLQEHIKRLLKENKEKRLQTSTEENIVIQDSPKKDQSSPTTRDNIHEELMQNNNIDPSIFNINPGDLRMCELLGKGFFGEVRRAIWKGTEIAVKTIYKDSFGSKSDLEIFYKELSIICKLRHPSVLQFIGACIQGGNRCIVTEYLKGGSLYQLIHNGWETLEKSPVLRNRIICDIIRGMTYLHDSSILHRDLTTKNLLLDSNLNCKICDFGLSRIIEETKVMTGGLGCLPYQAPEVFRGEKYSESADVYSFAMVVYELITGSEPNHDMDPLKFANMVAHEAYRPPLPPCSPHWERLITSCWDPVPSKRPTFKQLLSEFVQQGNSNESNQISKFDALMKKPTSTIGAYTN